LEFPVVFVAYVEDAKLPKLDDSRLLFDPQFDGKAGFGLIYSTGFGIGELKKEVYKKIWHQPRIEAEEKRLFYVALTRAKERLYVLRARQSTDWTAAEAYRHPGVVVRSEEDDPTFFQAHYWQVTPDPLPLPTG
jgi:ATP-dependent exoDNAse (exonuclease V) beta subunit